MPGHGGSTRPWPWPRPAHRAVLRCRPDGSSHEDRVHVHLADPGAAPGRRTPLFGLELWPAAASTSSHRRPRDRSREPTRTIRLTDQDEGTHRYTTAGTLTRISSGVTTPIDQGFVLCGRRRNDFGPRSRRGLRATRRLSRESARISLMCLTSSVATASRASSRGWIDSAIIVISCSRMSFHGRGPRQSACAPAMPSIRSRAYPAVRLQSSKRASRALGIASAPMMVVERCRHGSEFRNHGEHGAQRPRAATRRPTVSQLQTRPTR